jgi:23S rRNA (cytosine1962-C5)-methyltransferase
MRDLLKRAIEKRSQIANTTDAFRLINSEADGLGGITVDRLGPALLVERHREGVGIDKLVAELATILGHETPIFLKERWSTSNVKRTGAQVRGSAISPEVIVCEHGLFFGLHLADGEHTGLFLDGRPVRERVRELSDGKRVLNLFSYTGGFGLAAARGGARSTTNVDNKPSAIKRAKQNYKLNQMQADTRTFMHGDALEFLKRGAKGKGRFDLIVLDPPPRFDRPKGRSFNAHNSYAPLVARCLRLLSQGGLLLAGLNALYVCDDRFAEMIQEGGALAGRKIQVVEELGPGDDFPISADRPAARFSIVECN